MESRVFKVHVSAGGNMLCPNNMAFVQGEQNAAYFAFDLTDLEVSPSAKVVCEFLRADGKKFVSAFLTKVGRDYIYYVGTTFTKVVGEIYFGLSVMSDDGRSVVFKTANMNESVGIILPSINGEVTEENFLSLVSSVQNIVGGVENKFAVIATEFSSVKTDNTNFKTATDTTVANFKSDINASVGAFKTATDTTVANFKSDINASVGEITASQTNLKTRVQALENDGLKQGATIKTLRADIDNVVTSVASVNFDITVLESGATAMSSKIGALESGATAMSSKIGALESSSTAMSSKVSALESASTALTTKVNGLKTEIGDSLQADLTAIRGAVTTLETDMTSVKNSITTSSNTVTAMGNTVSAMDGKVTAMGNTVTAVDNKVGAMNSTVSAVSAKADKASSDVAGMQSSVTSLSSAVSAKADKTGTYPDMTVGNATKLENRSWTQMLNLIYPVGSIYMTMSAISPATIFGGTWVESAKGKVMVGYDSGDNDFNAVKKVGGSKALQAHTHSNSISVTAGNHTHGVTSEIDSTIETAGLGNNSVGGIAGIFATKRPSGSYYLTDSDNNTFLTSEQIGITSSINNVTAGTGNCQNLQPYTVCHIWERTSL